jgi:hypothetical protein
MHPHPIQAGPRPRAVPSITAAVAATAAALSPTNQAPPKELNPRYIARSKNQA